MYTVPAIQCSLRLVPRYKAAAHRKQEPSGSTTGARANSQREAAIAESVTRVTGSRCLLCALFHVTSRGWNFLVPFYSSTRVPAHLVSSIGAVISLAPSGLLGLRTVTCQSSLCLDTSDACPRDCGGAEHAGRVADAGSLRENHESRDASHVSG